MRKADVPNDLSKIQTKVIFNLTKRQLICFGAGGALGIPLYFLARSVLGNSVAITLSMAVALPFFLTGVAQFNGQHLEVYVCNAIHTLFLRAKVRPYQTNNYYALLQRAAELRQEVSSIVSHAKIQNVAPAKKAPARPSDRPAKNGTQAGPTGYRSGHQNQ